MMHSDRCMSRLLGTVFLVVALASIISGLLTINTIGSGSISEQLNAVAEKTLQFRITILIDLITSVGIVVLAVLLFVVLREQGKNIALVALGLYLAEAIILAISKISYLSLIPLSREALKTALPDTSHILTLGNILLDAGTVGWTVHMLFFSLGAILFYCLFYKAKSIPRWLAVWGLLAVSLALVHTFLGLLDPAERMFLLFPNMFFELTIGSWLVVKGFSTAKNQQD